MRHIAAIAVLILVFVSPVRANGDLVITMVETGGDVVSSSQAGGAFDLTGLTFFTSATLGTGMGVFDAGAGIAPAMLSGVEGVSDFYSTLTGPTSFGIGTVLADFASGSRARTNQFVPGWSRLFGSGINSPTQVAGLTLRNAG